MKLLFFCLTLINFSLPVLETSEVIELTDNKPCVIEVTIDQLIADDLTLNCSQVLNGKSFKIKDFLIKFYGHPSIRNKADSLNPTAKNLAKNLKVGDYVSIYISNGIFTDQTKTQKIKTLKLRIVET